MNTSVLIMNTPSRCYECNLCMLDTDGSISCFYLKREVCDDICKNNNRPNWCPLESLKENKKSKTKEKIEYLDEDYNWGKQRVKI